jgi:hypothetical protein
MHHKMLFERFSSITNLPQGPILPMTYPLKDQTTVKHTRSCEHGSLTFSSRLPEDRRANAMERGDKRRFIGDAWFDTSTLRKKMTSDLCEIRCI